MQNFQDIVLIWTQIYREIFKSALLKVLGLYVLPLLFTVDLSTIGGTLSQNLLVDFFLSFKIFKSEFTQRNRLDRATAFFRITVRQETYVFRTQSNIKDGTFCRNN